MTAGTSSPLLEVDDLSIRFVRRSSALTAVNKLSFSIDPGETLAIVGESGCGKTVTGLSLLGLLDRRTARVSGSVRLNGSEILGLSERNMRKVRGCRIAMIFQDPMTALNPVQKIGTQLVEAITAHENVSYAAARVRALELLERVRISEPKKRIDDYPHRLSGGMRQRVGIAMALAGNPSLLIADEPTTALDVTVQAQILRLLSDIQRELKMSIILITHDLGVVAETANRVLVMYAGRKVEEQTVYGLFDHPRHPYTRGLIRAKPQPGREDGGRTRLVEIPGIVPNLAELPQGCAFAERCPKTARQCTLQTPQLREMGSAVVACHFPDVAQVVGAA